MERRDLEIGQSRLRLHTIIRLRWVAVAGQTVAVLVVYWLFGFDFPVVACLAVIGLSVLLNGALQLAYGENQRLRSRYALVMLGYDLLQLSVLLFLTGGLQNPFALLLVVPVAVSASTQPLYATVVLASLAVFASSLLLEVHWPLPWTPGQTLQLPYVYMLGVWTALVSCILFVATYTWRTARETRQMSDALAAAELVLAREQRLSALDGLAAAAAHELGTPLSTITLIAKELERDIPADSPWREDIALLRNQAARCRDILSALTRHSGEGDEMFSRMRLSHLIEEVIEPYRLLEADIAVTLEPPATEDAGIRREPVCRRNPGVIYGLTNLVENAIDFAASRVDIVAAWDRGSIAIAISDDGPGFAPGILSRLGEPYVTTRPSSNAADNDTEQGMGLGLFIAKTLLERSGATLTLANCAAPETGALVQVRWPRSAMEEATVTEAAA